MSLAGLGFVLHFGHNLPWGDEWEFVPALTGHEPVGWPWLWAQHNEHRLPLPRAVYLLLFRLTGDFRAGMVLQLLLLSALALGLMRYVARVRGRSAWTDLFIPIGLLNWGHVENFLMGYQINFAFVCVLVCGMFVASHAASEVNRFRPALLVGCCLLLLEACGAGGLIFAVPVGVWLLWLAKQEAWVRNPGVALLFAVLAGVGMLYWPIYFEGYERPPHHPPFEARNAPLAAVIVGQYLSMGFGYGARWVWPALALLVFALAGWTSGRLVQSRNWGVLAVLAGACGLAAAVGAGRSGFEVWDMGLWSRYGLLAWPILFAGYLVATTARDRVGPWVQPLLAALALLLLPLNIAVGVSWATAHDRALSALKADLQRGVPVPDVVETHLAGSGQEERARRGIPMLQQAGIGNLRPGDGSK